MKYLFLVFLLIGCAKNNDQATHPNITDAQCFTLLKYANLSGTTQNLKTVMFDGTEYNVTPSCQGFIDQAKQK